MGGHASGLFPGATFKLVTKETAPAKAESSVGKQRYTDTPELRRHITQAYDNGRNGIGGGHEKGAFMAILAEMGGVIEDVQPCERMPGVENIFYLLPRYDPSGKQTGEMRSKVYKKTVYDSGKMSTNDYMRMGLEAANNAANGKTLDGKWSGVDSMGVTWQGYAEDGKITTFFPKV